MICKPLILAFSVIACGLFPAGSQAQTAHGPQAEAIGTWVNPSGTVKVETGHCSSNLCGWVVWAAPQAMADAKDSGVTRLVGTQLLKNYRSIGPGRYQGQVFVPDMGRTFYSTIKQSNSNSMRISGCILGGLICKSQDWRRV